MQFAIHGLRGSFIGIHTTLGKLPAIIIRTLRPEYTAITVHDNHAYIGSETIRIDHVCIFLLFVFMADVEYVR
jgi:hypothetical protein